MKNDKNDFGGNTGGKKQELGQIVLSDGKVVEYRIRRSRRAKRAGITCYPDGVFVVTIPFLRTALTAKRIVNEKRDWIEKQVNKLQGSNRTLLPHPSGAAKKHYIKQAALKIAERATFFNRHYHLDFKKIFIKSHKAQWGSCSSNKNLNFNYKLIFLPADLLDYVVVHELCHLKEMNHGPNFWKLVEQTVPDYKSRIKRLKEFVINA